MIYVCDSFQGLPPGDRALHKGDKHQWDSTPYLEVDVGTVARSFREAGVLDSNVVMVKVRCLASLWWWLWWRRVSWHTPCTRPEQRECKWS
jgi:hypothetical protein